MNIKKISAAVVAAVVLTVAAPMTGVLPDPLSVVASAASPDPVQTEYKTGDVFCASIDWSEGNLTGEIGQMTALGYECTVKTDGTIKIAFSFMFPVARVFPVLFPEQTFTIPSEINGYTVSEIGGDFCQVGCKKVIIPETVKILANGAFSESYFLEEVEFSGNSQLNLIDQWAFQNCRSLKSITIPANVETIAYGAFHNTSEDKKLSGAMYLFNGSLHDYNRSEYDFTDKYSLTTVKFAEGSKLKTIGEYAFENQKALTSIAIPEGTDSIAKNTFEGSSLKNIDGVAGSYAETFAKENGYMFNGGSSEQPSKPDDTSKPTDTPNTFTDDSGDKAADIEVIAKPNVIPKEAHFSVRLDDKNTTTERIAYNCFFTYNGAEYEPTDTVTVRIPVPVAMRDIASTLKVYHLQDGKYVNMSAKVEEGYLVFDTDHFSVYVVTAENLENGGTSTPTTSDKDNPNTGVSTVATAFGVAALAGAAVLVARNKRK